MAPREFLYLMKTLITTAVLFGFGSVFSAVQAQVIYFNDAPNNAIAMASRPSSAGKFEIETADDFVLGQNSKLTSATFTGLLSSTSSVANIVGVTVEIYRVFPDDSSTGRNPSVPTRVNSPSDVELVSRSSDDSTLTFSVGLLSSSFTALNSIQPGGIHPSPNQTTNGDGPFTGQEVRFGINFTTPISLLADHYFFVPQVQLSSGDFYWLSAARPISGPGTTPIVPDLQAWTRDDALAPDWLRVGTDIIGGSPAPTFNAAFSLNGTVDVGTSAVPEPSTYGVFGAAVLTGLIWLRRRKAAQK